MVQLRVIIVGTSPAETLRLEEALQQAGALQSFRYIGLEQALDRLPDWDEWDLLMARHQERTSDTLLSLMAPVLRKASPPVIFLVEPYDPVVVNRLLNAGARRVLPLDGFESVIEPTIAAVFSNHRQAASLMIQGSDNGRAHLVAQANDLEGLCAPDEGFSRLFKRSPIGICITSRRDGRCIDCNESFAGLLEWRREDLLERNIPELGIPADIMQQFEAAGYRADSQEDTPIIQLERTIFTRNRKICHVQIHLDLIEWAGEECLVALVQDITEKEQAKEKIRSLNKDLEQLVRVRTGALEAASRELADEIDRSKILEDFSNQLSQIVWETPDVIFIFSPDGKMQFLNRTGRHLFGLEEDALVSHLDLFSVYPEDLRSWIREKVQPEVIRRGIWHGETRFNLPDGRVVPLSQVLVCKKDEDGQIQYFASIARDVSDFKRVEKELRQSRELYRTLAEAAHDIIFLVSSEGLMEYANEYACLALGLDPGKVVGMPAGQFFPQDFSANYLQMFHEVHEINQPIYKESPFVRGKEESWLGTWLVPIHNERGEIISILGISRDISEQKKADDALKRALQNERRLAEIRSNFFTMTSHQFRTPLSTILLSAELMNKYGQRWDDQKRTEHIGRIQAAARRINSMLEDILVIMRLDSGRYMCLPKEFDLVAYIEQAICELADNDQGQHQLVFEHEVDELPVYLDPEVLHRVVDNLLSNAIKYSPSGTCVTIQVKTEGQNIRLEVTDQGIGIPERDLKYLFQPFQRGSNAGEYPGSGIGLAIVQRSVELMQGDVALHSKEGQGTTFVVRFPARFGSST